MDFGHVPTVRFESRHERLTEFSIIEQSDIDMVVDQKENCFPMIPSGAAHNEILLGPEDQREETINEEGMVLI